MLIPELEKSCGGHCRFPFYETRNVAIRESPPRVHVIYKAPAPFSNQSGPQKKYAQSKKICVTGSFILVVGTFEPRKFDSLIQAFEEINKNTRYQQQLVCGSQEAGIMA